MKLYFLMYLSFCHLYIKKLISHLKTNTMRVLLQRAYSNPTTMVLEKGASSWCNGTKAGITNH